MYLYLDIAIKMTFIEKHFPVRDGAVNIVCQHCRLYFAVFIHSLGTLCSREREQRLPAAL